MPETLYFAYGSNLSLKQMARRCPESRYIGIARLSNYKFQINERGYANVIPSPNHYVEGLCYLLSETDEARLDINEGVPTAYEKIYLPIELFTADVDLTRRKVLELVNDLGGLPSKYNLGKYDVEETASTAHGVEYISSTGSQDLEQNTNEKAMGSSFMRDRGKGEVTAVLVYLSRRFIKDDKPWGEYIERMNNGVTDARKMGVSEVYIDSCIRAFIPIELEGQMHMRKHGEHGGRGE